MPNLNKVMLMGNLTRDPELRYLPTNNTPVCSFGIAINRKWKGQDGQQNEETTFVDLEAFGRRAEVINEYLRKGQPVFIEGRLKLDQWQDRDGNNRSKLKVVVDTFEFLASGGDGNTSSRQSRGGASSRATAQQQGDHQPIDEDDIPF